MKSREASEKPPFELIEEAFHLVRLAPSGALAAYAMGTVPFVLALLYFWSDMSRSAFAEDRLMPGVLLLTALFVWMKTWQSVYCRALLARLCGEPPPAWTFRAILQTAIFQAAIQPAGLVLLPIGLIVMIPFGWFYALFTSATVIHGTGNPDLRTALGRTWRQMALWPLQNHYLISLFFLFGFFVFLNILTALLGVPFLAKMLLGIESVFTRSPWAAFNSTLLMAQVALTYLCLDPVVKAAYVLRCFHGESLRTGQDLRADLATLRQRAALPGRSFAGLLMAAGLLLWFSARAGAAEPPPAAGPATAEAPTGARPAASLPSDRLNQAIDRTIQKREFSWRLPRDAVSKTKTTDENSLMARFSRWFKETLRSIGRWLEDFIKWIVNKFRFTPKTGNAPGGGLASIMEVALVLLIVVLVGSILWLVFNLWQHRRPRPEAVVEALPPAAPDVTDENVAADELPEDGWQRLARELLARGELRLALRALYLATLSHLGERRLITLARFKSNHDYERELARRAHALGALPQLFAEHVTVFERVWYGEHAATPELLDQFSGSLAQMKGFA
jgi:hypothetical protein